MSQDQVEQIELQIEDAKEMIELGNAILRLKKNPDFKLVIENHYMRENAIRLVGLKMAPSMKAPELQSSILTNIDAIGALQQWLNAMVTLRDDSERAIEDCNEALAEMDAEVEA